ncbi:RAMP superfamily CRISPR-associated protein [Rhodococcus ruber]|uniref:RAMP superfamily CRISPR-associated protein n=1 Tax=Rhodococcus ruber TaxID=1830 RepID=UPI000C796DB2|nr:RAMP superfamily CRISPR-associated protein [Rhodococcus ruber]AUM20269.1 hypothetical protein CSW53_27270 [Rhodococcus ruber]
MTAPYTFVDFRTPLPGSAFGDDTDAVFDRPVPGRHSGRIDLTITTLSPLFIGSADDSGGQPVLIAGVPAIPGSALKGMLRAYLAAMSGSSLGPQTDTVIWYRNPVADSRSPTLQAALQKYRVARGATAEPGSQRVGLLVRDPVHGHAVRECPQLRVPLPGRSTSFYSLVPRVTWRILSRDLAVRRHLTDPGLSARNDRRVFVVWAAVETTSDKGHGARSVRKVVFAVGGTAHDARRHAHARRDSGRTGESVPTTCRDTEFVSFLDDEGLYQYDADPDEPIAVEMILHATGLTAPDEPDPATDEQRNAYLFPIPDTVTAGWIADSGDGAHKKVTRVPVANSDVVTALTDDVQGQATDYHKQLPTVETLLAGDGVPVFFDTEITDGTEAVGRLGRGGGFRIRARKSFLDTIDARFREAGFDAGAPDLVQSLFGDSADDRAKKGRVSVGIAIAAPGAQLLSRQPDVVLLGPKIQAWYRYLHQLSSPHTDDPRTYDHADAAFRGRKMYLHRWHRNGQKDEQAWKALADRHRNRGNAGNRVGRTITPVAPRARFTGSIRFTNLTAAELGALIVVVTLGNDPRRNHGPNDNPHYAHLLGGGRALGLGSVHLASTVYLDHPGRYDTDTWDAPGHKADGDDLAGFVEEFRAKLHLAEPDQHQWAAGPDGRRWLRSIAEVFLVAQWHNRLPAAKTADMSLDDHRLRKIPQPLIDLFGS